MDELATDILSVLGKNEMPSANTCYVPWILFPVHLQLIVIDKFDP
jgi:hypothetical protein